MFTKEKSRGFTLIELLIVVAIIGILAAIAIPNLLAAIQRSKQKRTMADMRVIAATWESYAVDWNYYLNSGYSNLPYKVSTAKLMGLLEPGYVKDLPNADGWGHRWIFNTDLSSKALQYEIISYGKDQTKQGTYVAGPTTNFNCDIIYSMGQFVVYPEGAQKNE